MFNLNSTNELIWSEFSEEYEKARFWFFKKMGSTADLNRQIWRLERKSAATGRNEVSELIEYKSKNGNKWITCLYTFFFGGRPQSTVLTFAYYETVGSYGAFLPLLDRCHDGDMKLTGVQIFTSHFFLRAKDRLGFKLDSKEDLARCVNFFPSITVKKQVNEETGETRIDYQLDQGIARGIVRSYDPVVIEVRTCLSQKGLNRKQAHETAGMRVLDKLNPKLEGKSDSPVVVPGDTVEEQVENMRKGVIMMGGSVTAFDLSQELVPIVYGYFRDLHGVKDSDNHIWAQFRNVFVERVGEFSDRWNEMDIETKRDEISRVLVDMTRKLNFPKTKFNKVRSYLLEGNWKQYIGKV